MGRGGAPIRPPPPWRRRWRRRAGPQGPPSAAQAWKSGVNPVTSRQAARDEQGRSGPYQREIRQGLTCHDSLGDFGGEMLQPADKAIRRALANARGTSQRVRLAGESGSVQETIRTPTTATAGPEEGPHQGQAGRRNAGARRTGACPASPPERRISARCARQKSPSAAESASTCPRHEWLVPVTAKIGRRTRSPCPGGGTGSCPAWRNAAVVAGAKAKHVWIGNLRCNPGPHALSGGALLLVDDLKHRSGRCGRPGATP